MKSKITFISLFCLLIFLNQLDAQNKLWSRTNETELHQQRQAFTRNYQPQKFLAYQLDEPSLRKVLKTAPSESRITAARSTAVIEIPDAAGKMERFRIVEAPVMEPGLAARYPEIKTYAGQGIDDPTAKIRFDMTPEGFHGMILSAVNKTAYINPVDPVHQLYIVFNRDGLSKEATPFNCMTPNAAMTSGVSAGVNAALKITDGNLRTYRFAVASGGEFSQLFLNGTETTDSARKAKVLAGIVSDLTRVNGINENDFGIRLLLVDKEDTLIFLNGATDPFTSNASGINNGTWNLESQKAIDSLIGNSNYDIGHLLMGYNTGGNAYEIGSVCNATTKGTGVTGLLQPTGDPFTVDYWDHEIGHQFGDNHTFDFSYEGTGAQMEPGSGSTIMSYAGVTGQYDIQAHSDPYFHAFSIYQTQNYITTGLGASCAILTPTGDQAPSVSAGPADTIPISTPFTLTASGSDPDPGDVLTYCWEQYDSYANDNSDSPFPDSSATNGPVFRSLVPANTPGRTFPVLSSILDGSNKNKWEVPPAVGRTLHFRVTVRDNHLGGGETAVADQQVTVTGLAGPFTVTAPNTAITWYPGDFQTVRWKVAGTDKAPVNCQTVDIYLSLDGGQTFPVLLASGVPNNGAKEIQVPDSLTTKARIKVSAHGNIFFDIDDSDFTIANAPSPDFVFNHPDTVYLCHTGSGFTQTLKTGALDGFSAPVSLSATGNPPGSTVLFGSNPLAAGSATTITLNGTIPAGTYTIDVQGTSGSIVKNRNLVFELVSLTSGPVLDLPADASTGADTLPVFSWHPVSGAAAYVLEISATSDFSSPLFTIGNITDTTYTLTTPLAGNTQYYWRVSGSNDCGTGTTSGVFLFRTALVSCQSYTSTDVPKTISAIGTPTVISTLTIPDSIQIADLNVVGLYGTHSYINDLKMSLTGPTGTTVILFNQICGADANFNLNLDDQAATAVFPCPPIGGVTVRPQQPLSGFNNESSKGLWTLTVNDLADGDGGQLSGWGLRICSKTVTALPVSWLSFTAEKGSGNSVLLHWSTANESNNAYYEIEKSSDGKNFFAIGSLPGGNTPGMTQHYFYTDLNAFNGENYYRIKQVDRDGQYRYSITAIINLTLSPNFWLVYPNPAIGQTTVQLLQKLQEVSIILMDITGKKLYGVHLSNTQAGQKISIPLQHLTSGLYLLKLQTDQGSSTKKIEVN